MNSRLEASAFTNTEVNEIKHLLDQGAINPALLAYHESNSEHFHEVFTVWLEEYRSKTLSLVITNDDSYTLAHLAVTTRNIPALEFLKNKTPHYFAEAMSRADDRGLTPLATAIRENDVELTTWILANQENISWDLRLLRPGFDSARTYYPSTLYDYALDCGALDCFKLLHRHHLQNIYRGAGCDFPAIFADQEIEKVYSQLHFPRIRVFQIPAIYTPKVCAFATESGFFLREFLTAFLFSSREEISEYLANTSTSRGAKIQKEMFSIMSSALFAPASAASASALQVTQEDEVTLRL